MALNERNFYTSSMMPGIDIVGVEELKVLALEQEDSLMVIEAQPAIFLDAVASYVTKQFRINKDAKRTSGIEDLITEASQQYNGEYSNSDLQLIRSQGGTVLFMNITATKCRAAASWIRDIQLATNQKAWTIRPTPKADLPADMKQMIDEAIRKEFETLVSEQKGQQAEQESQGQLTNKVTQAQDTIREVNQNKRDIEEAIYSELQKEAEFSMKVMERQIQDQLIEGDWYKVFSDFIDDFVVYPSAFIKGPITTNSSKVEYVNGVPTKVKKYCYKNRRVSPWDIYPAPEANSLNDGALCEHLRFFAIELNELLGLPGSGYKDDVIVKILQDGPMDHYDWLDSGIESEKADQEKRGDATEANQNVFHGIHFFGPISAKVLQEWGIQDPDVLSAPPWKEYECEAIVVGHRTIKCVLNSDPVITRPYYTASYQKRPGSVWGRSLPDLMRDIQRMCNATARALANNMALAAGPQIQVYIERLADQSDLEDLRPFKIWQMNVDPTGAGGKAVDFFQPTSNASELLAVYKEFELRADDATGIPRYAYGNEQVGQAASTSTGLSMLLESASKGIKDAIRNIDSGVIIPRIEHQFYLNLIEKKIPYTGDVEVEALGSNTLTLKGAEQIKRNEFLQITANQIDQEIMGVEGRAALLREMAKDLGFIEDIVPTRLDLKKKLKQKEEAQAQQAQAMAQAEQQKAQASLQATQMQVEGQMQMNQLSQQVKAQIEQLKDQRKQIDQQLQALGLQLKEQQIQSNTAVAMEKTQADKEKQLREIALKLREGEGI